MDPEGHPTIGSIPRTIDDLDKKTCWICYEEETRVDALRTKSRRRWVHPCHCTLLAHEDCLLKWISEYQATHRPEQQDQNQQNQQNQNQAVNANRNQDQVRQPVKCPSCKTEYEIVETEAPLLRSIERFHKRLARLSVYSVLGVAAAGLGTAFVQYGDWATRRFLGKEASRALFLKDGPIVLRYLNLALVAPVLICSRIRTADKFLPVYALMILVTQPSFYHYTSSPTAPFLHLELHEPLYDLIDISWPPPPNMVLLLLPAIREHYFAIRKFVFSFVLSTASLYMGTSAVNRLEVDNGQRGDGERADGVFAAIGRRLWGGWFQGWGDNQPREVIQVAQEVRQEEFDGNFEVIIEVERPPIIPPLQQIQAQAPAHVVREHNDDDQWVDEDEEQRARRREHRRREGENPEVVAELDPRPEPQQQPQNQLQLLPEQDVQEEFQIIIPETTSFSRLITGALIFPLASSMAGTALHFIATETFHGGQGIWWLKTLLGIGKKYPGLISGKYRSGESIWLRNFWGAGLILLLRDVLELVRECLELQRIKSRRVKGRPLGDLMFD